MANKQARALADGAGIGVSFRCNDVVEGDSKLITEMEKGGVVDSDPDAVTYAKSLSDKVVLLSAASQDATENPTA